MKWYKLQSAYADNKQRMYPTRMTEDKRTEGAKEKLELQWNGILKHKYNPG